MNNTFFICDRLNSVFKQCYSLFSFHSNDNNYLVYTYSDDGYNYYLLISRLKNNSFGKLCLSEVTVDEKNFFSQVIHDLIINLPINYYRGFNGLSLIEDYFKQNSFVLLNNFSINSEQPIFNNSFVASTSKSYIDMAINYFLFIYKNFNYLNFNINNNSSTVPVDESKIIIPIFDNKSVNNSVNNSVNKSVNKSEFDFFQLNNASNKYFEVNVKGIDNYIDRNNHFALKEKNAGFASSRYIIIGTICLVLAFVIVFISIMFIKNL